MENHVVNLENKIGWSLEYIWNVLTRELDFRLIVNYN
jgi:hypothetical protein